MGFLDALGRATPAIMSNIGQMKQMAINDETEKREAIKFQYQQKKLADEEAEGNKLIPLSLLGTTQLGKYPSALNMFVEHARSEGAVQKDGMPGGREMIRKNDMRSLVSSIKLTNEFGSAMMQSMYNDAEKNYFNARAELASGKIKKPEELAAATKKVEFLKNEWLALGEVLDPKVSEHLMALEKAREVAKLGGPKYNEVPIGEGEIETRRFDPGTGMETVVGTGTKKGSETEISLTNRALKGDPQAKAILDSMEERKARIAGSTAKARSDASTQVGEEFTPEALDFMANRFIQTGELPGMGMGKAATQARIKVLNKVGEMTGGGEGAGDQALKQATYKASRAALTSLETQKSKILAFSDTASKNLKIVEELSQKVDRTGIPVMNKWINAGKRSIAGDADIAKLDAVMRTAINEYAKVTSSATGGGVTSDQARREVDEMLNAAQTQEQVSEVVGLLRREMENRRLGFEGEIQQLKGILSGSNAGGAQPSRNAPQKSSISQTDALKILINKNKIPLEKGVEALVKAGMNRDQAMKELSK